VVGIVLLVMLSTKGSRRSDSLISLPTTGSGSLPHWLRFWWGIETGIKGVGFVKRCFR